MANTGSPGITRNTKKIIESKMKIIGNASRTRVTKYTLNEPNASSLVS
jgi:hypothetical protein